MRSRVVGPSVRPMTAPHGRPSDSALLQRPRQTRHPLVELGMGAMLAASRPLWTAVARIDMAVSLDCPWRAT
ncbi:hypothetical protein DFQ14_10985 [Halopolyspora algeriensis]|uniref:Uncharacterized protein n=1 Tax=Halopolyspora algeriensis TaxID=1500506 RepID=A0A368VHY7_9ACTN|nr:hypothetical protein DFQ14_10985 [Halopolyspora algeriensis]TQM53908.1 hypothetical protein FHU43_2083 [Halopolyspora algeriensis]